MRVIDPLRKPDVSATPRAVLPPFLPTLGLAVVAALLSLACREPAKDAPKEAAMEAVEMARPLPAMAAAPGLTVFDPGRALLADVEAAPAGEAFARLMPLAAAGEAAPPPARAPRVAARGERRRGAPVSRTAATQPASPAKAAPEPTGIPAAMAPAPVARAEEEDSRFLPAGALPFAAVDAVWDAARSAGSGAAAGVTTGVTSLGSSVVGLVADLR